MNNDLIIQRLKEARKMSGLSQGQAAKLLDMHRPTISEIEAGNRKVTVTELKRFADIYEVSTTWLLGEVKNQLDTEDPRVKIAARELSKLSSTDLDKILKLLAAMKNDEEYK